MRNLVESKREDVKVESENNNTIYLTFDNSVDESIEFWLVGSGFSTIDSNRTQFIGRKANTSLGKRMKKNNWYGSMMYRINVFLKLGLDTDAIFKSVGM